MVDYIKLAEQCFKENKFEDGLKYLLVSAKEQNDPRGQRELASCYLNGKGTDRNLQEALRWYIKSADNGEISSLLWCGYTYYLLADYAKALEYFYQSAKYDDINALFFIGHFHQHGLACEKSEKEAFKWHLKAAEKGQDSSQEYVGIAYYEGRGVEINYHAAVRWLMAAKESGSPDVLYYLGLCYENGYIENEPKEMSIELFKEAAENGHIIAQYKLGSIYLNNASTESSLEIALDWIHKSASQGYVPAQSALGNIFEPYNLEVSIQWTSKAANNGDVNAQFKLGVNYYPGGKYETDMTRALYWLEMARQNGSHRASALLAEAQFEGIGGVVQNYSKAVNTFSELQNCGDEMVESLVSGYLGLAYYYGYGTIKDRKQAFKYLTTSEAKGHLCANGQFVLGLYYFNGEIVARNYEKAFKYFSIAHSREQKYATCALGVCYLHGKGVLKDKSKGIELLIEASQKGVHQATDFLKDKHCIDGDFESTTEIMGAILGTIAKETFIRVIGGNNED